VRLGCLPGFAVSHETLKPPASNQSRAGPTASPGLEDEQSWRRLRGDEFRFWHNAVMAGQLKHVRFLVDLGHTTPA
jgi:hypothetical protein